MAERSGAVEDQAVREGSATYSVQAEVTASEDVPAGYKRTEVGVIPEDWDLCSLESVGIDPSVKAGPFGSSLTKSSYTPSGYKVYGQEQVIRGDHRFGDYFIGEEKYRQLRSCAVRPGDVLISLVGTAGKALLIPDDAPLGIINPRLVRVRLNQEQVNAQFFKYLFESNQVQDALTGHAQGGTMDVLNARILRALRLPTPRLQEQRAIATALSDADTLIESLDRLIAKKRAIKQAVMQQLLTGQTRLPGFTGEWETKRLGVCGLTYGGITGKNKADFGKGSARYVTFLNVFENVVVKSSLFDTVDIASGEAQNRVSRGDLLFNGTSETPGDLAMGACVDQDYDDLYLNSFCFGFRFHKGTDHDPLFFAYVFRGPTGRQIMNVLAQGATRYNMSKRQFLDLECELPEGDEQREIATTLSDMDAEIGALERRRDKARQLKQGMMQELLTGRVRLVTPEAAA